MYPGLLSSCRQSWQRFRNPSSPCHHFPAFIIYLFWTISGTSKALVGAALRLFSGPGCKDITMEKKGIDSASWLLSPSGLQTEFPQFFFCFVKWLKWLKWFLHSEAGVFYYINIHTMETQALKSEQSTVCVCHFVCVCVFVCIYIYCNSKHIWSNYTITYNYMYIYVIKGSWTRNFRVAQI